MKVILSLGASIAVLVLFFNATQITAQNSRPATVEDILRVKSVLETQISPDGSQVIYTLSEPDLEENFHGTNLWLINSAGGIAVKLTKEGRRNDSPRWSPDGRNAAFISNRENGNQIWLLNLAQNKEVKLTNIQGLIGSLTWSPDGKQIAFLAVESETEEARQKRQAQGEVILVEPNLTRIQIYSIDVETKQTRELTSGNFTIRDISWSPDSKEISFSVWSPQTGDSAFVPQRDVELNKTFIKAVYVDNGRIRTIAERRGLDTSSPKWSPDGKKIAFLSSDDKSDFSVSDIYLYLVSASGGAPRNLTPQFDERIAAFDWSPDNQTIYFSAPQRVNNQLFSVSLEIGKITSVTSGNRVFGRSFSFSKDFSKLAFPVTDPTTPTEVYVSSVTNFNPVKLTDLNPHLKEVAFGQTEVIRWKSSDGTEVEGLLVKPVGYQTGKRYPLLTYAHGGPTGAFKMSFAVQFIPGTIVQMEPFPVQVLAGQGYAIFMPNPRGSIGYGEKFRKGNIGDLGGGDYRDIMSGVDYLIGQGIADGDRLGIMGGSYGGYMAAWAITQTDKFKAASVYTGQKNLVSDMGQSNASGIYGRQFFSSIPSKAKQEKEQRSPINFAANVKTPVLLQQGEADNVNPLPQSYEFYNALRAEKVPVEFAIYPRQGHYVTEPKLQVDMLSRNINWFNRWLKEK